MIRFADGLAIIAESEGDVQQRTVNEANKMFKSSEMKINSAKTKISVRVRDPPIEDNVHIGSQKLDRVHDNGMAKGRNRV